MTTATIRKPSAKQLINKFNAALEQLKAQPTKLVVMIKIGHVYVQVSKATYRAPGFVYVEDKDFTFHPFYFSGLGYDEKIEKELDPILKDLDKLSESDTRTMAIRLINSFKVERVYTAEL
jgi:hypothetical protein